MNSALDLARGDRRHGRFSGRSLLVLVVALSLICSISSARAHDLLSEPSIALNVTSGSSSYARWIEVDSHVDHGTVTQIGLCIVEIDTCEQQDYSGSSGVGEDVERCVNGDSRTLWREITFPTPGTYRVVAEATANRCLRIGPEQHVVIEKDITIEPAIEPPPPPPLRPPIPCADEGAPTASDVGVTEFSVMLGATIGTTGPHGADARYGIEAAVADINATGGVCGRLLELTLQETGGDPAIARAHVQAMASRDFALIAMPDARGLQAASMAGDFEQAELPVVGTTGLSTAEFSDPWIWSVGGAPEVFASIVVAHDYDAGARQFGLVTEGDDPWLTAAHDAVVSEIETHDDASLCGEVILEPGLWSYRAQAQAFDNACPNGYDAILYLLSPRTFLTWMAGIVPKGSVANDLPAHLVGRSVAENCQAACNGFVMWDPFRLPFEDDPTASRYRYAVIQANANADPYSAMTEASYVGTYVAAAAMGQVGVHLTRAGLKDVLDTKAFRDDLVPPVLTWGQDRAPNHCLRGYAIRYVPGTPLSWRDDTGWICG